MYVALWNLFIFLDVTNFKIPCLGSGFFRQRDLKIPQDPRLGLDPAHLCFASAFLRSCQSAVKMWQQIWPIFGVIFFILKSVVFFSKETKCFHMSASFFDALWFEDIVTNSKKDTEIFDFFLAFTYFLGIVQRVNWRKAFMRASLIELYCLISLASQYGLYHLSSIHEDMIYEVL